MNTVLVRLVSIADDDTDDYTHVIFIYSQCVSKVRERVQITRKLWQHLAKGGWSLHHLWQAELGDFFAAVGQKSQRRQHHYLNGLST